MSSKLPMCCTCQFQRVDRLLPKRKSVWGSRRRRTSLYGDRISSATDSICGPTRNNRVSRTKPRPRRFLRDDHNERTRSTKSWTGIMRHHLDRCGSPQHQGAGCGRWYGCIYYALCAGKNVQWSITRQTVTDFTILRITSTCTSITGYPSLHPLHHPWVP